MSLGTIQGYVHFEHIHPKKGDFHQVYLSGNAARRGRSFSLALGHFRNEFGSRKGGAMRIAQMNVDVRGGLSPPEHKAGCHVA